MRPTVHLTGRLVCADAAQARVVASHLPEHVALTRAEDGCELFEVHPLGDGLTWTVEERFRDPASFEAHQRRVAGSDWGRATADVERRYVVRGLEAGGAAVGDSPG